MGKKHYFKSNVNHDGKEYLKGQEVPQDILAEMSKQGLVTEEAPAAPVTGQSTGEKTEQPASRAESVPSGKKAS
jgi:hypothetical protein